MTKYAIIVAGGSGTRMNAVIPKQFIPVAGLPVLMHTIQRFASYPEKIEIILVLPEDQTAEWKNLCQKYSFDKKVSVTTGGASRFQSVKNGLRFISEENGLVAIQDGVRPFATQQIIEDSYKTAVQYGNGIAAVPLKDSIRSVTGTETFSEDRNRFRLIQTPQTFQLSLIRKAYLVDEDPLFTDDASVLERSGEKIFLSAGSYQNIKITTPEDLLFAEAILKNFKYQ